MQISDDFIKEVLNGGDLSEELLRFARHVLIFLSRHILISLIFLIDNIQRTKKSEIS